MGRLTFFNDIISKSWRLSFMAQDVLANFANSDQIVSFAISKSGRGAIKDVLAFGPNVFGDKKLWEVWYFKSKHGEYDTCFITEFRREDGKVKLEFYQNFSDFAFFLNSQIEEKSNEFQLRKYAISVAVLIIFTVLTYSAFLITIGKDGLSAKEYAGFIGSALVTAMGYAFYRRVQNAQHRRN